MLLLKYISIIISILLLLIFKDENTDAHILYQLGIFV